MSPDAKALTDRCDICGAPTGADCEDCGGYEDGGAIEAHELERCCSVPWGAI